MKIGQKQNFTEIGGHFHDGFLHQFLKFAFFHRLAGGYFFAFEQIDEFTAIVVAGGNGGLQLVGGAARLGSKIVASFVCGYGEEPRTEAAFGIELGGALMHLEKRFLENIFSRGAVADEPDQEMEELALIRINQAGEGGAIAFAVSGQEIFVGLLRSRSGNR